MLVRKLTILVFDAMQRNNVQPNEVTYTSIIVHAGRAGEELGRAYNKFVDMKSRGENVRHVSRGAYESLMGALVANEAEARDQTAPVSPQRPFTGSTEYNSELGADGRTRCSAEVVRTEQDYLALLSQCASRNELFQAFLVLGEMKRCGLNTYNAYNAVLDICARAADSDAAVDVFESMKRAGHEPNVRSYTSLIKASGSKTSLQGDERNLLRVFLIFLEMQTAGCKPDKILFNALVDACRTCKQIDKAFDVLSSMKQHGVTPDEVTYNILLKATCEAGPTHIHRALSCFEAMQEANCRPTISAFEAFITTTAEAGLLDKALEIFNLASSCEENVSVRLYEAILRPVCASGRLRTAAAIWERMEAQTLKPSPEIVYMYKRMRTGN